MGSPDASTRISLGETLSAVRATGDPGEPLTASEVAETLECSRRTAFDKLNALVERGDLRTKKTGARGRVWWRPVDPDDTPASGRASESALARAQFRELVEAVSNYAIFVLDPDGHVASWNRGAAQLKGYTADEIIDEHFSVFYTDSDRTASVPEGNLRAAAEQDITEDEGWRVRKDGTRFWADVTITALRDDDGELQGFIKVTRDMTERRRHEEELRREKERFESLVQEVADYAIFMLDPEGHVQSWNSGIERIKGYTAEDILGEHFSVFYTEADRAAGVPERNLAAAARDGQMHDEGWRVRKDGAEFWADVTITALRDDDGELRGFTKVTRDMTEQHEFEQQILAQREELDELNTINADIREIDRALVSATTRQEIEDDVCDRIAASSSYAASWIGEFGPDSDELAPRAWAGVDGDSLAELPVGDDAEPPVERVLATRALETGSVQTRREDSADAPGSHSEELLAPGLGAVAVIPLAYDGVEYGVLAVYAGDSSAFDDRKLSVLGELGETISHAIAAIEHRERERAMTTLHESTRELLHAETRAEIGDIVVTTATEDLDVDCAMVYDFDTTENLLEPLTASESIRSPGSHDVPTRTLAPGDDSRVWSQFVDGDVTIVTQPAEDVLAADGSSGIREWVIVPLGDHGVLVVGATEVGTVDASTQKLVELLGSTAQAAFTRLESEANLRERDEVLQEQNRRLQRINELNTVVREIDQRLVGATSRAEIQRAVCEVLTTVDRFRLAWIGDRGATRDGLTPVAWDGTGRGYLDSVTISDDEHATEPAVRTARTGELTVVSNVADDLRDEPWRKEAFGREFQSVVSVPLTYGDHNYGVLTVYADRPGIFGETEQSILAELGYTIAHAINTVEMKQALFADRVTELEFELPPGSDYVLPRLAAEIGARVEFEGVVPCDGTGERLFFTVRECPPDAVRSVLDQSAAVESGRLITEREGGSLFEAVVSGRAVAADLTDHNASLRTLTASADGVTATIDVPATTDVREFVEHFESECPGVEFVARRERDRPIETQEDFRTRLESSLTDRQREVLELAYFGGYFESPRASTGEDLATALDVSRPTVTTHLRAAQRRLLDLVLAEHVSASGPRGSGDAAEE